MFFSVCKLLILEAYFADMTTDSMPYDYRFHAK